MQWMLTCCKCNNTNISNDVCGRLHIKFILSRKAATGSIYIVQFLLQITFVSSICVLLLHETIITMILTFCICGQQYWKLKIKQKLKAVQMAVKYPSILTKWFINSLHILYTQVFCHSHARYKTTRKRNSSRLPLQSCICVGMATDKWKYRHMKVMC